MTECYACAKLAELLAENSQLRVKCDELTAELNTVEMDNEYLRAEIGVNAQAPDSNDANADTYADLVERSKRLGWQEDSREKLEADSQNKLDADLRGTLLLLVDDVAKTAHEQTFNKHLKVDAWWNAFARITDRQAAITEREREQHWLEIVGASANCNLELTNRISELQAKVDELTRENARLSSDEVYLRVDMEGNVIG